MDEVEKISKQIDFSNLTYYFKSLNITPINFIRFRGPLHTFKEVKSGSISLQKAEEEQK